jgi:enoyl-CoA hydratase
MPYSTLVTSLDNNIFTVTINRPDKLNALNSEVMNELNLVLDEIDSNREIRVVILTGAGQKAFVAGADISEFVGVSKEEGQSLAQKGQTIFFRIENNTKPIIAAVNGFALGGGCELAMACHFRIASENAKFGQPEVNLGLIPGYGGTQRLVHLIGSKCITAANAAFTADGYTLEVEAFGACFATDDMKEGAAAFLEKRKPIFQGK